MNRPYLITKSLTPENQETPIQFITDHIVETPLFYRRNHFPYPAFLSSYYWLPIDGHVHSPKVFTMQEILALPSKTNKVILECAGNKRGRFEPKVFGEQWGKGAISQGIWKGVPLRALLQQTGYLDSSKEVVFEGYDFGERADTNQIHYFSRSLPLEKALHPDTIIAYEYNHQPISFKHGYPLRLIVPEWYAMASVKWLKKITVIDHEFSGPFQAIDYVYCLNNEKIPVTTIHVNSTIQNPLDRQVVNTGLHQITGIAWTGTGRITNVEVSLDGGVTWALAELNQPHGNYAWVKWSYNWYANHQGEYTILSKAIDSEGHVQPQGAIWNPKGYGYNAMDMIHIKVE